MLKRLLAVLLCMCSVLAVFAGCANQQDEDYKGQTIMTYLTTNVYDLDPAHAYSNEALADVVGLMFDTLFVLDENGKVKKSLVKDYTITENEAAGEYELALELKDTKWSDGTYVSANDVVFAWKRVLEVDADFGAAALLFDIKNARAAKMGDASIDDVAIYAEEERLVTLKFEGKIDYDQFLLNLTSVALAPLREDIVTKSEDWAKKPGTMVCSGPFRLGRVNFVESTEGVEYFDENAYETEEDGEIVTDQEGNPIIGDHCKEQKLTDFTLERNSYYYRNTEKNESIFKYVKPYRINVDCTLTDEQLMDMYKKGIITYIGDIPMSLRGDSKIKKNVVVEERSMSTNSIYFNENASISGYNLFANQKVRQALSVAIDRSLIADSVVYADPATGLIPTGVKASGEKKKTFRENCSNTYEYLGTDLAKAQALIKEAEGEIGSPSKYRFAIKYAAYDDVHKFIAETVATTWSQLGFKVTAEPIGTIANNEQYYKGSKDPAPTDMCDDLYAESLRGGSFEVILLDVCAMSTDPYGMLAPFAKGFNGRAMDMSNTESYVLPTHVTGYDSAAFNDKIEAVFAEKNIKNRAADLYEAEKILMEELPVVPIVFNKRATVTSKELKGIGSTYYVTSTFSKLEMKNGAYEDYLAAGKKYVNANFADMQFRFSVSGGYSNINSRTDIERSFAAFQEANTIYTHFVMAPDKKK